MDDAPMALDFLRAVHDGAEGFVEFRSIRNGSVQRSFRPLPLDSMPALPSETHDIFYGVAPRSRRGGKAEGTGCLVRCAASWCRQKPGYQSSACSGGRNRSTCFRSGGMSGWYR